MANAPIFIKIDEYKNVLDILAVLKKKIKEGKDVIAKINQLKNEEDSELESWSAELDELEKKAESIDRMLFRV